MVIQDIIIPDKQSECSEWISYFAKIKSKFGETNARIIWLKTWQVNGSTSCTTNPGFLSFTKKNNIDVSNAATRAVADISSIGSNFLGLGKNLTQVLAVGIPATLAAIVLLILYFLFRTARNTNAKDVANIAALGTPQGRAVSLLSK